MEVELENQRVTLETQRATLKNKQQSQWKNSCYELLETVPVGIVAALMVPGALLVFPNSPLEKAAENPFTLLSLCSVCLIIAMVGLPAIKFILMKLRNWMQE